MQLTRFDRWLRETFVYETHIRTLRPADLIPKNIKIIDLPESPMQRYRHLYIARRSQDADALIQNLRDNTQMFATEIVEKKAWYVRFIAPANKSITWWLVSACVTLLCSAGAVNWVRIKMQDPKFRENIGEALKLFTN